MTQLLPRGHFHTKKMIVVNMMDTNPSTDGQTDS